MKRAMTVDNAFTLFVLNPAGLADSALALAGCRAGAVGVINAEAVIEPAELAAALARLAATHQPFGLKWDGATFPGALVAEGTVKPDWLILDAECNAEWLPALQNFRAGGGRLVLELSLWREEWAALEEDIDGWWVKGHEAGGMVGEESSFVLLQRVLARSQRPVYVRGGIGLHTAAACQTAGAAGVVLDSALLLLRESPVAVVLQPWLQHLDGTETTLIGDEESGCYLRALDRPGLAPVETLRQRVNISANPALAKGETSILEGVIGWRDPVARDVVPIGQEIAFAAPWAERYGTVAGVIRALRWALMEHSAQARRDAALAEYAPLAGLHGVRFPIVQGAMTRVSDCPEFAEAVSAAGALPMMALAMLSGARAHELLEATRQRLGERPWGVGMLGFVPSALREEQLAAIRAVHPPFAYIAGGRPEQARQLDAEGIHTYLHVPTPTLLQLFLEQGVRRLIFEGRECGGHVGPLSSFVLWESMIEGLLAWEREHPGALREVAVLFAGGIHDARSAAMVATLAAPLTQRGGCIGILMGTAYILTEEAVRCGAIREKFQQVALDCTATTTLTTGPGHVSRCAITPFVTTFHETRRQWQAQGEPAREIRNRLDALTLGRLRLATKGLQRVEPAGELQPMAPEQQFAQGMYLLGQVAALHDRPLTLAALHHQVTADALDWLAQHQPALQPGFGECPADVAIIGIGVGLPGAWNARDYWRNLTQGVGCLQEIPPERWDWRLYYDPDPAARDRICAKWGGFIAEQPFDPTHYGLPPVALKSIDPLQLLTLTVVRQALEDARIDLQQIDRERVAVVLGTSGGLGELGLAYATRADLPRIVDSVSEETLARLPEWTEDSFAGLLPNVAAGRVSNRFDFGGVNCAVDAACASSLAAVYQAVNELRLGHSDLAIAGGADTMQSPFMYLCFAKTQALSPQGWPRTFDEQADGIAIAEGVATVVLKRLADAERDGDRVYAVIKGIAGSSDGRAKGLTAPRPAGQLRALRRAYQEAGYSPATVGLWEAHGTGTVAGDRAELESVTTLLNESSALPASGVIGSVKTLIGHTKAAAGVAGLIKAALALHHRVLPPHRGVDQPLPPLREWAHSLAICPEARPWLRERDTPRRASVSAFGFGGTNFHATLEEYPVVRREALAPLPDWPVELCVWRAADRAGLSAELMRLQMALQAGAKPRLAELAATLAQALPTQGVTLAIVAGSLAELEQHLTDAQTLLALTDPSPARHKKANDIFLPPPWRADGECRLAVLFPGQGSQYPDMLRELAVALPELAAVLEQADIVLRPRIPRLSTFIYPPHRFTPETEQAARARLTRTEIAQPALGAVAAGLWAWLKTLDMQPEWAAGHSYGEYVALHAAGVFDRETLLRLSEARGRFIVEAAVGGELGAMLAARADVASVKAALTGVEGVTLANNNAPQQQVLSGSAAAIEQARQALAAHNIATAALPVAAAFHSPLVEPARAKLAAQMAELSFQSPTFAVYGNATAGPYPQEPAAIRNRLAAHLVEPVNFAGEIEAMYAAGARLFLEVGPRDVLTRLTRQILGERPHQAIAVDGDGLRGLLRALGALLACGVPLKLTPLFAGRVPADLPSLDQLLEQSHPAALPSHIWLLSGAGVRRPGEPRTLGAKPSLAAPVPVHASPSPPEEEGLGVITQSIEDDLMLDKPSGPPGATGPAPVGAVDPALAGYQETMRQFLRVQENVMLAYFAAGREDGAGLVFQPPVPPAVVAPTGPAPVVAPLPDAPVKSSIPPPVEGEGLRAKGSLPPSPLAGEGVGVKGDLKTLLLNIASERTGYPPDLLGLDQDIEADLGIDSIKRVEILGLFRRSLPESTALMLQPHMEVIANLPTFRQILDMVAARLATAGEVARPFESTGTAAEICAPLSRWIVRAHEESLVEVPARLEPGLYLLTPDNLGVADALSRKLREAGVEPMQIPEELCNDPERWQRALDARRQGLGIRAVIHLLPLGQSPLAVDAPLTEWRARITLEVKSLFHVLRRVGAELRTGGRLLTVSGLGGGFGRDSASTADAQPVCGFPGSAGLTGLVKTLNLEWNLDLDQPDFIGKALDFDPTDDPERLAALLFQELALPGGRREVGYPKGVRTIFRTVPASLSPLPTPLRQPDESWVVLATGGARGITAETLHEWAPFRPTLVLLGRTLLPQLEEAATRDLADAAALRRHWIAQAAANGQKLRPSDIERRIQAVLRDREIRANLADFAALGARVDYRVIEVRDEAALAALFDELYQRYGRIDAVIHGAGIIEDGWLLDKSPASMDRVIDTKVDSAFLLARYLRPETLKFIAFFTSVAGRFGNRGQADYATANEIVTRLAWALHARWGNRVTVAAIHWSPWEQTTHGVGMVTPEVRRQFEARGVHLVRAVAGRRFLLNELLYGPPDEVELVAGDFPWEYEETRLSALPGHPDPAMIVGGSHALLQGARWTRFSATEGCFDKTVDLISDPYLDHHRLDGVPVLPFAVAMEYMAEAVASICPDAADLALTDVQLFRGLSWQGRETVALRLTLREFMENPVAGLRRFVLSLSDAEEPARLCYQAIATIGSAATCTISSDPLAPTTALLPGVKEESTAPLRPIPLPISEIYRRWLFHGPLFQTLTGFMGYHEQGMVATLQPSQASRFYPPAVDARWQFDPALVDGAFQALIVWSRLQNGATPLPSRLGRIRRVKSEPLPERVMLDLRIRSVADAGIKCDLRFTDADGRVYLAIDGFECTASAALNRLGGGWAGGVRH